MQNGGGERKRRLSGMDIKQAVLEFFEKKGGLPGKTEEEKLDYEYLDLGIIDSMGIVEMITYYEEIFQIHFSPADMQSKEFRTPKGLISIIERLKKRRNNA